MASIPPYKVSSLFVTNNLSANEGYFDRLFIQKKNEKGRGKISMDVVDHLQKKFDVIESLEKRLNESLAAIDRAMECHKGSIDSFSKVLEEKVSALETKIKLIETNRPERGPPGPMGPPGPTGPPGKQGAKGLAAKSTKSIMDLQDVSKSSNIADGSILKYSKDKKTWIIEAFPTKTNINTTSKGK